MNLCSGWSLTDEEKELGENKAAYDTLVGKGMFAVALQYAIMSSLLYLGILIYGTLYIVMGKEWV